jgi:hypothetical protein
MAMKCFVVKVTPTPKATPLTRSLQTRLLKAVKFHYAPREHRASGVMTFAERAFLQHAS